VETLVRTPAVAEQKRSAISTQLRLPTVPVGTTNAATNRRTWIVSPWFDLAWLVNAWWLLAWLPDVVWSSDVPRLEFWQVYFLTTPHRWLTLLLVAVDPDRRAGRRNATFVLLALGLGLAVFSVRSATGAFTCLLLVDYVWNAWHFASQHSGVLRMYSRLTPREALNERRRRFENFCLRGLVLYTFVRLAGWSTGWIEGTSSAAGWLAAIDLCVLGLPLALVAVTLSISAGVGYTDRTASESRGNVTVRPLGKQLYLVSVCGLYASLLLAVQLGQTVLIASLATAVAAFHAIEYLAVVTHYAEGRTRVGSDGFFRSVARHWRSALVVLLVAFGCLAALAEPRFAEWWLGLNVWAALVHYTFDGMIWKLRRAETARALGLAPTGVP